MSIASHSSPLARRYCRDTPPLLHEPEPPIQRDRGGVVREHAQAELVQAAVARPADRGREERRADAAAAPFARHRHPDLAVPVAARHDMDGADDPALRDRHQIAVERPARGASLDVDGRLGRDPVPLLGHGGEQDRERAAILIAARADLDDGRAVGHLVRSYGSWRCESTRRRRASTGRRRRPTSRPTTSTTAARPTRFGGRSSGRSTSRSHATATG